MYSGLLNGPQSRGPFSLVASAISDRFKEQGVDFECTLAMIFSLEQNHETKGSSGG
jgi:hypothetical protein